MADKRKEQEQDLTTVVEASRHVAGRELNPSIESGAIGGPGYMPRIQMPLEEKQDKNR